MGCITKILELKGDKEFLLIPETRAEIAIEDGGNYKGYEYLITFNERAFRCGYVAIPPSHPTYNFEGNYPDFSVHGGVSFFDKPHLLKEINCDDKWIGFDAHHSGDLLDIDCQKKYFPGIREAIISYSEEFNEIYSKSFSTIKSKEYMIQECKNLIDQLIDIDKGIENGN